MASAGVLEILIKAKNQFSKELKEVTSDLKNFSGSIDKTKSQLNDFNSVASRVKTALMGIAATFAGGAIAKYAIESAGAFEKYQVALETITGSAKDAQDAMQWIEDFAKRTPYELDKVTQAFTRLASQGADPKKYLEPLGNMASAMNKDIIDAVEAFNDALVGEFERLKEFGIRAKQDGEQVTLTWRENGEEISKTVNKTASDISGVLMEVTQKFQGGMDKLSATFLGRMSTLKDNLSSILRGVVVDSGLFDSLKSAVDGIMSKIDELKKNGTIDDWVMGLRVAVESVKPLLSGLGVALLEVFKLLGSLSPVIVAVAEAWVAQKVAVLVVIPLIKSLVGAIETLRTAYLLLASQQGILGTIAALKLFTQAVIANIVQLGALRLSIIAVAGAFALIEMGRAAEGLWEWYKAAKESAHAARELQEVQSGLKEKLAGVSQQVGIDIKDVQQLIELQNKGVLSYDEATGSWKRNTDAKNENTDATIRNTDANDENIRQIRESIKTIDDYEKALRSRITAQESVLDGLKSNEAGILKEIETLNQEHVQSLNSIQQQRLSDNERIADKIREINRSSMSDINAYYDQLSQAQEKLSQAQKNLDIGNLDGFKAYAQEYENLITGLANRQIEEEGKVIQTREQSNRIAIEGLQELQSLNEKYYALKIAKEKESYLQKQEILNAELEMTRASIEAQIQLIETLKSALSEMGDIEINVNTTKLQDSLIAIDEQISNVKKNIEDTKSEIENAKMQAQNVDKTMQNAEETAYNTSNQIEDVKLSYYDVATTRVKPDGITDGLDEITDSAKEAEKALDKVHAKARSISYGSDANTVQDLVNIKNSLTRLSPTANTLGIDKTITEMENIARNLGIETKNMTVGMAKDLKKELDSLARDYQNYLKSMTWTTKNYTSKLSWEEFVKANYSGNKYASGGVIPGYGGGDKVPALLEKGEFVLRKEAVRKYGLNWISMLNKMNFPIPKFSKGGSVSDDTITISLNMNGQTAAGKFKNDASLEGLIKELKKSKLVGI